jgi:hypothetical protein
MMSRSGYSDDCDDNWQNIMWRGQVSSAIRGKRGQAFLRELLAALDAMPVKALIRNDLEIQPEAFIPPNVATVCTLGAIGKARGLDMADLDPYDYDKIADTFGIAHQLVQEIEWLNDEIGPLKETPEHRWQRMRDWVAKRIKDAP